MTPTSHINQRVREVVAQMSEHSGIPAAALMGKTRTANVVRVRYQAIQQAKAEFPEATLSQLARCFNRGHHTTVLYALRKGHTTSQA